jgi:hypothetical protein
VEVWRSARKRGEVDEAAMVRECINNVGSPRLSKRRATVRERMGRLSES